MPRRLTITVLFLCSTLVHSQVKSYQARDDQRGASSEAKLAEQTTRAIERQYRQAIRDGDHEKAKAIADVLTPASAVSTAYITKILETKEGKLLLDNNALVKLTESVEGLVELKKSCILFKDGNSWYIWMEGKGAYKCDILRINEGGKYAGFDRVTVNEVDNGRMKLHDGRMLAVNPVNKAEVALLIPPEEALLLNNGKLVTLDEGRIISVTIVP